MPWKSLIGPSHFTVPHTPFNYSCSENSRLSPSSILFYRETTLKDKFSGSLRISLSHTHTHIPPKTCTSLSRRTYSRNRKWLPMELDLGKRSLLSPELSSARFSPLFNKHLLSSYSRPPPPAASQDPREDLQTQSGVDC